MQKGKMVLYEATEKNFEHNGIGILKNVVDDHVREGDGLFELEFTYYVDSFLFNEIKFDRIIKTDASPNFKNQLFRIYYISKNLNGYINVKAQHISYDLLDNFIESLELNNIGCKEALEKLFRACEGENRFRGHSDIESTNSINIEMQDPYSALCEGENSLVKIFAPSAKLYFDNFDVFLKYQRGKSKNVLLAYKKNIVGLEAEYDFQNIVTKIYPYATYDDELITLPEKFILSKNIGKYSNEKISKVDFSSDEVSIDFELREKAEKYFEENNVDMPKVLYKVNFVDLSKTENYKEFSELETVDMDDEIIIRDLHLNINATARIIKTDYSPILQRYYSIEVGDLINHLDSFNKKLENTISNKVKEDLKNIEIDNVKFPDTLPPVSVIEANGLFTDIQLEWTFKGTVYYHYELYASQIKGFTPDTINFTNRIFEGKASAFLHSTEPNQTWYYRVRAGNTHNHFTEFSEEVSATTTKIKDGAEYFEEAAISHALIKDLDADKITVGTVKGTNIDAKNLTVTDGNKEKTLEIDSFGNINMNLTSLKIKSKSLEDVIGIEIDDITQLDIFNKLTNDGAAKGLYMYGNELFLNASYIKTGKVDGEYINAKNLVVRDKNNEITFNVDSEGKVYIKATSFTLQGKTIEKIAGDTASTVAEEKAEEVVNSQTQRDIFNKLTDNGVTQGIYLEDNKIYINASYIQAGTISCDKIGSSSTNPYISLFENSERGIKCAIDATASFNEGIGDALRYKRDDENYLCIRENSFGLYQSGYPEYEVFKFGNNGNSCFIDTVNGKISFEKDKLYYENAGVKKRILLDGDSTGGGDSGGDSGGEVVKPPADALYIVKDYERLIDYNNSNYFYVRTSNGKLICESYFNGSSAGTHVTSYIYFSLNLLKYQKFKLVIIFDLDCAYELGEFLPPSSDWTNTFTPEIQVYIGQVIAKKNLTFNFDTFQRKNIVLELEASGYTSTNIYIYNRLHFCGNVECHLYIKDFWIQSL